MWWNIKCSVLELVITEEPTESDIRRLGLHYGVRDKKNRLGFSWELFTRKATVGKGQKIGKMKSIALSN